MSAEIFERAGSALFSIKGDRHLGFATAPRHSASPRRAGAGAELELGILEDMLGYQLRRAQMRVSQHFSERLNDAQITPGQLILLIKISSNPGISQTALAKANGIERSTLGEIVDRFEKRNWVERRRHATDRRAYALHLSPLGQDCLEHLLPPALDHEQELTAGWSDEERHTLLRLLKKLAQSG